MDHAVTIRDLILWVMVAGGILGLLALAVFLLNLFNPFRSGH